MGGVTLMARALAAFLAALAPGSGGGGPTEPPAEETPKPVSTYHAATPSATDDFRLEAVGFYANYSEPYGHWYGTHGRFWLLDVTGQRGMSGYLDLVDLHWRPNSEQEVRSTLFLGRLLINWTDFFYSFATVGGAVGESVFPRLKLEGELNFVVPSYPSTVLAFGGGRHGYDGSAQPFVLAGVSYALAKAAFIYRIWFGRGVSRETTSTQLLTWFWGQRLHYWVRVDLLWGEASLATGQRLPDTSSSINSRSVSITYERWLTDHIGMSLRGEVSHAFIVKHKGRRVRGTQAELGAFITF
jgi:YaiO family outer membrane protein